MNFIPCSPTEREQLYSALEANAHRDEPIFMNPKTTKFIPSVPAERVVEEEPPQGLLGRIGNWFAPPPRRVVVEPDPVDLTELDDMVSTIRSIPSHY